MESSVLEDTIQLTVDEGLRSTYDVCKRCTACKLSVFVPRGKDRENTINIVTNLFDKHHVNCKHAEGPKSSAV
jgi:glycine cleavage system regulatory protein